jgi:formylglycine-generating enzyme required for sulfatase activity
MLAVVVLAALAGCSPGALPPEGQIVLSVDTDAILPPGPGESGGGQMPIFDRLRVEIFAPGTRDPCAGCTREFGVDHRTVFEGRASIGVVPPPGEGGHLARVRLYRSSGSDVVTPRPTSTLEAVAALPAVPAEGVVEVHVVLRTDDLGAPQGLLDAPIPALPGPAAGKLAGTWAASFRAGCSGAPADGEVCVPGGAFWMGDPSFEEPSERLVAVSPFYVDAAEVTVARFRAAGFSTPLVHGTSGAAQFCTFTAQPGAFEDHPVNCVSRVTAAAYCAKRGGALISEAAWEFVASGRRSAPYVWGTDAPECAFGVFERYDITMQTPSKAACKALGVGVQPPGSGTRDRLDLEGGAVVDLVGNLSEWMRDEWEPEGEPCWSAPILRDPVCKDAGGPLHPLDLSIRGSSFTDQAGHVSERLDNQAPALNAGSAQVGFRCARPAPAP